MPITCIPYPVFTPTSVGGCLLWFDTYDASYTTSGNTVTSWTNKTGNANAVTGVGTASINQTTLNGKTSVRFPAGSNYFNVTPLTYTTSFRNIFIVGKFPSAGSQYSCFCDFTASTAGQLQFNYYSDIEFNYPGRNGICCTPSGFFDSPCVFSVCTSTSNQGIWVTGNSQAITVNNLTPTFFPTGTTGANLGPGGLTGSPSSGTLDMYEFIQYDGIITSNQRQQIEGYLAQKWGLTAKLPGGHPGLTQTLYTAPKPRTFLTRQAYTGPAPTGLTVNFFTYIPKYSDDTTAYYNVTPSSWTTIWQPYLQKLAAANSSGVTVSTSNWAPTGLTAVTSGWNDLILAPNGKIYNIPLNATNILVVDPVASNISHWVPSGVSFSPSGWSAPVLHSNGNIYCMPSGSGNILVINPAAGTASNWTPAGVTFSGTWPGSVLGPNGKIYGIPYGSTNNILVIDPTNNTGSNWTPSGVTFGGYYGGVLGPDGKIYGVPSFATNILVIDPVAGTASNWTPAGTSFTGSDGWRGGVLHTNGKIYCVPTAATNILVINALAQTASNWSPSGLSQSWETGFLHPNGKIYCPRPAGGISGVLIIDPIAGTVSSAGGATGTGTGAILHPNGNAYSSCRCFNGINTIYTFSTTGLSQLPNSNYCLSAYANKV